MSIKKIQLPKDLKPLFWSYQFKKLNTLENKRLIIIQTINYGSWRQWQWLLKTYGHAEIKKFIETTSAGEFRPQALKLISTILSITKFAYAPRGAHQRS